MRLARFFLTAALVAAFSLPAGAGERQTTWRAGDAIWYRAGCHNAEIARHIAEAAPARQPAMMSAAPACFAMPRAVPARLVRRVSGPHRLAAGPAGTTTASVWQIFDALGDTEFVFVADHGGPHPAARQQAL